MCAWVNTSFLSDISNGCHRLDQLYRCHSSLLQRWARSLHNMTEIQGTGELYSNHHHVWDLWSRSDCSMSVFPLYQEWSWIIMRKKKNLQSISQTWLINMTKHDKSTKLVWLYWWNKKLLAWQCIKMCIMLDSGTGSPSQKLQAMQSWNITDSNWWELTFGRCFLVCFLILLAPLTLPDHELWSCTWQWS